MKPPDVSIILPTYNRSATLGRAIKSVLNQTYSNFELIIVDSGSDEASEIVDLFDDERISYFWQEPSGLSAARNFGMAQATTDIFAFQDDDDEWLPNKLDKQMEVLDQAPPEVGVVYTGVWKIHEGEKSYVPGDQVEDKEGDIHDSVQYFNFISPQTVAVRKRCFSELGGFDESLSALEDWEMWLRISREFEFRYIDEPLVRAYISPDSLSINYELLSESRNTIVEKHFEMFDKEPLSRHLFWSGHGMMKTRQTRRGQRNLWKALRTDFKSTYLLAFMASLMGSTIYSQIYDFYKRFTAQPNKSL